jgi:rhodanese-related sulfurtransferase
VPAAPTALADRGDVSVDDLKTVLAAGARVIDVRTPEEFATGHVPGAVNIPVDAIDPFAPPLSGYSKEQPLYLICRSGRRSATAAEQLAAAGFPARNVLGGTLAWKDRGFPVE